jgi:murein DD-endopeptidase MepM/ murein hydrolase activator NlpD
VKIFSNKDFASVAQTVGYAFVDSALLKKYFNNEIIKKELISVMQKDDRNYSFLLTRSTKSKIYIKRIEISKKLLHTFTATAFLLGIISIGIFGFIKYDASTTITAQAQTKQITQEAAIPNPNSTQEIKSFNYSRPASANLPLNRVGGPNDEPFQLTNEPEAVENNMEAQIRAIETNSSPEYIPSMWAHLGKVNNEYGYRRNPFGGGGYEFHAGMDINGERGDTILAPAKGRVVKAGWQGGYGNLIEIDHGNGLSTRYGHLSRIGVQIGDTVERGQLIGLIGSTGRSTGPHLHYEVRLGDKAINPRRFLPPGIN